MAPLRTFAIICSVGMASAFTTPPAPVALKPAVASSVTSLNSFDGFKESSAQFEAEYPNFSKYGWGPSVHAEVWNGRHAMFGWVFMCATAYAKGHGLIPNPDTLLDLKEWGTLATISGKTTLTNERSIVLIANVHCFMVGLMATIAPNGWSDPLLLDPNSPSYDRVVERNKNPYGVVPAFKAGLTEEAEMYNGRLAMIGIIVLIGFSCATGKDMIDIINEWVGGAFY